MNVLSLGVKRQFSVDVNIFSIDPRVLYKIHIHEFTNMILLIKIFNNLAIFKNIHWLIENVFSMYKKLKNVCYSIVRNLWATSFSQKPRHCIFCQRYEKVCCRKI